MREVEVTAASRLHFGLLAPGAAAARRFGGCGVMVSTPQVQVRISAADELRVEGPGADRVREFVERWRVSAGGELNWSPVRVRVESLPRLHSGLGLGTQLALAVARGLDAWHHVPHTSSLELARRMGRGRRSAIGTHGFESGGFLAELGKDAEDAIAPLHTRVELPDAWRWVLICPPTEDGLSGRAEQRVFAALPHASNEATRLLTDEMLEVMVPAARAGAFAEFSESLFRFGRLAGEAFSSVQGGPYNGPELTQLVESLRAMGIRGVGQSSWGPTIFALCPDESDALALWRTMRSRYPLADVNIATTANRGVSVRP